MIVSINAESTRSEFDILLNATIKELNKEAIIDPEQFIKLAGRNIEPYIKEVMTRLAIGTQFENSIELIAGQKFPDIIAKKFFGVEVKTTTQHHWKTTGNSVLESTRVESVERIFMLFAKLAKPVEFKCRPYEDVLSEVVVTHSPRYLIDMNLQKGDSIFDKLNIPYDVLRKKDNPIKPIVEYYKGLLKPGDELWWMDSGNESKSNNLVIRLWNNLSMSDRHSLRNRAYVYFPELFSNSNDKFSRVAIWLTTREGVVCPNVRDIFTAGGRDNFFDGIETYTNIPRIALNLLDNFRDIVEVLNSTPPKELTSFWNIKVTEQTKLQSWIDLISYASKQTKGLNNINISLLFGRILSIV